MTRIKICGLKSQEDISCINELKPDYVGFVFLEGRHRYISPEKALLLKTLLHPSIQSVGVFVNEAPERIISLAASGVIDMIQLHGQEDEKYMQFLKKSCSCPVIKAFIIKSPEDLQRALDCSADYLLLDNGSGTGKTFDWSLIQNLSRPFFLAGGLTPGNVKKALSLTHPYGVDVSSGVETDFRKDPHKIKAFIDAVHRYDS